MPGRDGTEFVYQRDKFETRARALFFARLAFMAIGLGLLFIPAWNEALSLSMPGAAYAYLFILGYHVASYVSLGRAPARTIVFVTLCLDLVFLVCLIALSGGVRSPLMHTQLVFTMLFVLLYPRPLAILPPLLTLPVVARIAQIRGTRLDAADLLLLLWYSAVNCIVVYVVVYLDSREESGFHEVLRLQRQKRRAELAEQRARLAREIHDGLGAALSSVLMQAEYLKQAVTDDAVRAEVGEMRAAAEEGMEELRRAVSMMRDDFELVPAMEDWAAQFSSRARLPVRFEGARLPEALSPEAQLALFRVMQEALTNAARHAGAKVIDVAMSGGADAVTLLVRDDGRGFDAGAVPAGHYGLRSMRERLARLGGALEVESAPGAGTSIVATIPVR